MVKVKCIIQKPELLERDINEFIDKIMTEPGYKTRVDNIETQVLPNTNGMMFAMISFSQARIPTNNPYGNNPLTMSTYQNLIQ